MNFTYFMNFFSKVKFFLKKPRVIIVTGNGRVCAAEAISQVLNPYFKIGDEVLIFSTDLKNPPGVEEFQFYIKGSKLPILVVTHIGDIPPDKDFFAGDREKTEEICKLAKHFPSRGYLVLNFDDETIREIADITNLKTLTFGFQEGADFKASDLNLNRGTNFKINYKGNIVPIWLEKLFGKEQIYSGLAAACIGTIFDLNLVEISQTLKNYYSLPGRMRLVEGIKNSWILDDSESATVFSMVEAIEILGKIQDFKRKIAVLGDVIGIGKYTIEAHEAIGEKVARNTDLLFTFGQRAHFIAEGARNKGMPAEKILSFDVFEGGKTKIKEELREGDLVLVDGSKEMEMGKIVEGLKSFSKEE